MAKATLDLHGKTTDEVFDLVDCFIMQGVTAGLERVRIASGKGKGLVQAELKRYLKQAGYPWQYEKGPTGKPNDGVLVVFLQ